jgi:hypothetical protein
MHDFFFVTSKKERKAQSDCALFTKPLKHRRSAHALNFGRVWMHEEVSRKFLSPFDSIYFEKAGKSSEL